MSGPQRTPIHTGTLSPTQVRTASVRMFALVLVTLLVFPGLAPGLILIGPHIGEGDYTVIAVGPPPVLNIAVGEMVDVDLPERHRLNGAAVASISNLPAGLRYNARRGKLTGRAVNGGSSEVAVKPKDGKDPYTFTIRVADLPSWALGSFTAMISSPGMQGIPLTDLGGYLTLASTSTGAYTGNLRLGHRNFPFRGRIEGDLAGVLGTGHNEMWISKEVTDEDGKFLYTETTYSGWLPLQIADTLTSRATVIIDPRNRNRDITLALEFRPEDHATLPGLSGSLTYRFASQDIGPAWRHVWDAAQNPAFGNQTQVLEAVINNMDAGNGPQEQAFATIMIDPAGRSAWNVTVPTGQKLTGSFAASPDGDLPFYRAFGRQGGESFGAVLATELSGDICTITDAPRPNGRLKQLPRIRSGGYNVNVDVSQIAEPAN